MATGTAPSIEIRRLGPQSIHLIAQIDRSEHLNALYHVADGVLVQRSEDVDVPQWDPEGRGDHSVRRLIDRFLPVVDAGAPLLGAFDRGEFAGLAIVDPSFEPPMAWLALLHVSRLFRRMGVAGELWTACSDIAREAGAESMYVSATPSNSAVGFYLSRGCRLATPPHPDLFTEEPEDIHLVCQVR